MHNPQKVPTVQHQPLKSTGQQQIIHDLTSLKLNSQQQSNAITHSTFSECDENKPTRQHVKQTSRDLDSESSEFTTKPSMDMKQQQQNLPYNPKTALTKTSNIGVISTYNNQTTRPTESDSEKAAESDSSSKSSSHPQPATVHSTPLSTINKSLAIPVSTTKGTSDERPVVRPKAKHQIPSGNLVVPPRKPISSVAPTTIKIAPKIVAHSPKVHMVAPNVASNSNQITTSDLDKLRPALPPKPAKSPESDTSSNGNTSSLPTVVSVINKPPISEPAQQIENQSPNACLPNTDNLPIKAKPLTIKKQPLSEQPRLRSLHTTTKPVQYTSRRIEMPPSFLFPEIEKANLKDASVQHSPAGSSCVDETDKSTASSTNGDEITTITSNNTTDIVRRTRSSLSESSGKTKLSRRVSFDPLALLLDASLEGELELVKKTTMQVSQTRLIYYKYMVKKVAKKVRVRVITNIACHICTRAFLCGCLYNRVLF